MEEKAIQTGSYFALFKHATGYFFQNYSEETKDILEKEKSRIEKDHDAKFVISGKVINLNQKLGVERLVSDSNEHCVELNVEKIKAILENEDKD